MTIQQMMSLALCLWNFIVFLTYGVDKYRARKQAYRISEKTLLLMAYFFGGLGAWGGGTYFRHKTQKVYFRLAWAVGVLIDILVIYWIGR
ncbi:DUF1294 domain-containing protein [Streptococcus suis]|nr:DUF1294 domain-containing protein [Streptococcus suis]